MFAHIVKEKGAETYSVRRLVQEIRRLGYPKIILKSDQEPAIRALKEAVMGFGVIEIVSKPNSVKLARLSIPICAAISGGFCVHTKSGTLPRLSRI